MRRSGAKRGRENVEPGLVTELPPEVWPYGHRFMIWSKKYSAWYAARAVSFNVKDSLVQVNYCGWGPENDEILPIRSDRFANEEGGKKVWKRIPGAAGAFMRIDGGPEPVGKLLDALPPPCKRACLGVVKAEQKEATRQIGVRSRRRAPEAKDAAPTADAAGGMITNIRAFGAQQLEPDSAQPSGLEDLADQGLQLQGGVVASRSCPEALAATVAHTGDKLPAFASPAAAAAFDKAAAAEQYDGKGMGGNLAMRMVGPAAQLPLEPAATTFAAAAAATHTFQQLEPGEGPGGRQGSAGREMESRGKRSRKPTKPAHCTPGGAPALALQRTSTGSTSAAIDVWSDMQGGPAAQGAEPEMGRGTKGSAQAAAACAAVRTAGRPPRRTQQQQQQQQQGSGPGTDSLSAAVSAAMRVVQRQHSVLEWTAIQLGQLLCEAGQASLPDSLPPKPEHPNQAAPHDVQQQCQQHDVKCSDLQRSIGERLDALRRLLLDVQGPKQDLPAGVAAGNAENDGAAAPKTLQPTDVEGLNCG